MTASAIMTSFHERDGGATDGGASCLVGVVIGGVLIPTSVMLCCCCSDGVKSGVEKWVRGLWVLGHWTAGGLLLSLEYPNPQYF